MKFDLSQKLPQLPAPSPDSLSWTLLRPTGKPPVHFQGVLVLGEDAKPMVAVMDYPDEKLHTVRIWQLSDGSLMLEEQRLIGDPFDENSYVKTRVRVLETYQHVWSFFDVQYESWIDFLDAVGDTLGVPGMFWIPLA